jgi:hypothetical protein
MFHPDILAALAKERRSTMLAEAAAARQARQARETRRHRRVPGSPGVRRVVPAAGKLRDVPLIESVTRIGQWLAGLPGTSGLHRPATVAAHEKGSEA